MDLSTDTLGAGQTLGREENILCVLQVHLQQFSAQNTALVTLTKVNGHCWLQLTMWDYIQMVSGTQDFTAPTARRVAVSTAAAVCRTSTAAPLLQRPRWGRWTTSASSCWGWPRPSWLLWWSSASVVPSGPLTSHGANTVTTSPTVCQVSLLLCHSGSGCGQDKPKKNVSNIQIAESGHYNTEHFSSYLNSDAGYGSQLGEIIKGK